MPCTNPRIIVNPHYINSTHIYCNLDGFSKSFYVSKGRFDFKYFSPKRRKITLDELDKYLAFDPSTGDSIPVYMCVPCGKCDACRLSKRYNLRNRMILEQYGRKAPMYFVTLTYNDEHLPDDGVSVRDCQLFFKRFRERLYAQYGYTAPFRYILFSEYGKLRGRAHYHFIVFGLDFDIVSKNLQEVDAWLSIHCWHNGFVRVMLCDAGAFNYVSKYVLKKSNVPSGKNPNFVLSSRLHGGIGCSCLAFPDIVKQIADGSTSVKVNIFGKIFDFPVPKQVINYAYKDNVQALRRKYLPHVRRYFEAASCLSSLYICLKPWEFAIKERIDAMSRYFVEKFGFSFLEPQSVAAIAPYAPEFFFFANETSSNNVARTNLDYYLDMALSSMCYLATFDVSTYPDFLENSNILSRFASEVHLKLLEKYGSRIDFSDDAPIYSSKLNRVMLDFCADFQ